MNYKATIELHVRENGSCKNVHAANVSHESADEATKSRAFGRNQRALVDNLRVESPLNNVSWF